MHMQKREYEGMSKFLLAKNVTYADVWSLSLDPILRVFFGLYFFLRYLSSVSLLQACQDSPNGCK